MKNYYDKQRESVMDQIDYLYDEKDVTFRGFRHSTGQGKVGEKFEKTATIVPINKSELNSVGKIENEEKYDPTTLINWENTSSDGDRFEKQEPNYGKGNKSLSSYDSYLKKKAIRQSKKSLKKQKFEDSKKLLQIHKL